MMDEQQFTDEIKELEQKVTLLENKLAQSKNDLKFLIGLAFGENTRPRKRILCIPGAIRQVKRDYGEKRLDHQTVIDKDMQPPAYKTALQERYKLLVDYQEKNDIDIHYAIGSRIYEADSLGKKLVLPFSLWKIRQDNRKWMSQSAPVMPPIAGIDEAILFIATNGVGLGHLTRCLAVARKLKKLRPDAEIIFLTTSLAVTAVRREGFTPYCIPSRMIVNHISMKQWNALMQSMLQQLMQLYSFSAIIFDGALPYAAVAATLGQEKKIPRVWIRRGTEKAGGISERRDEAEKDFDYVILPCEAGEEKQYIDEKHFRVNPIIFLDKEELWTREQVRKYFGIPEEKKVVYIQLGAGNVNDIDSELYIVIQELRKRGDILMILGESLIGEELHIIEEDILIIKDYPNSKYFGGFDFAISACGYNSFHELLYFGVPTIFLPNGNTGTDDQYARAKIAEDMGVGIVITDITGDQIPNAIGRMLDEKTNADMRHRMQSLPCYNGSAESAELLMKIIDKRG